ncbi:hypothetical protein NHX12_032920 [Muraenolepis orangiensis]|uniref:Uncharacterized protein n=1 Tax=Muraenolepis orangiensis TaxID=630683 RepID=A0A9Q0E1J9_9TELE|nr:hypothetical protein NHX12_032920 [Muraenolepis orangiensis]
MALLFTSRSYRPLLEPPQIQTRLSRLHWDPLWVFLENSGMQLREELFFQKIRQTDKREGERGAFSFAQQ